ncbi:MAG: ATP synthase F0 subunit B [Deltaproteobacteria bacterium]|nr:ATP synthase F0 subunit B [Deltaproteobacteria bacterium]
MVSVAIDWTLIAQLITFLVLMFILNKILYQPILAILKKREGIYDDLKEKAQESKEQLEAGEKEEVKSRNDALSEGAKLQGALRSDGQREESDILKKAQDDAAGKLEVARNALKGDVEAARVELKSEASSIAREMASKILRRELTVS